MKLGALFHCVPGANRNRVEASGAQASEAAAARVSSDAKNGGHPSIAAAAETWNVPPTSKSCSSDGSGRFLGLHRDHQFIIRVPVIQLLQFQFLYRESVKKPGRGEDIAMGADLDAIVRK